MKENGIIAPPNVDKEEASLKYGGKRSRLISIVVAAVAVVALGVGVLLPAIGNAKVEHQNQADYAAAAALYDAGDYVAAAQAFKALGDWEDAQARATAAANEDTYRRAIERYDVADYEEAWRLFRSLGAYKDSAQRTLEARSAADDVKYGDDYAHAQELYAAGKWDEAYRLFSAMEGYKDSAVMAGRADYERTNSPKYAAAEQLLKDGSLGDAYLAFLALGNYGDSAARAREVAAKFKVGSTIRMGRYEQDNNTSNGKEPIEWIVLGVSSGKVLLVSKYALDCQPFNTKSSGGNSFDSSSLASWLKDTFKSAAGLGSITDAITLLSMDEVKTYFGSDGARIAYPTSYAVARGAWKSSRNGGCYYWLRSASNNFYLSSYYAAVVHNNGTYGDPTYYVTTSDVAVRPAIWLTL